MTAIHTGTGGALARTTPDASAATVLPLDGVAIGATLGAISGGAIASQPSTPAAVYHLERRDRPAS